MAVPLIYVRHSVSFLKFQALRVIVSLSAHMNKMFVLVLLPFSRSLHGVVVKKYIFDLFTFCRLNFVQVALSVYAAFFLLLATKHTAATRIETYHADYY